MLVVEELLGLQCLVKGLVVDQRDPVVLHLVHIEEDNLLRRRSSLREVMGVVFIGAWTVLIDLC